MADIVIRGVDVPKGDLEYVSLWVYGDGRVYVSNQANATSSQRLQDLVISLPEGHGRMIDADTPIRVVYNDGTIHETTPSRLLCKHSLLDLPKSIVPAEGGGEE